MVTSMVLYYHGNDPGFTLRGIMSLPVVESHLEEFKLSSRPWC